jgi:PKD repeat protein
MLSKLRRKRVPRGTPFLGPPPTKRWRYPIAQWVSAVFLLSFFFALPVEAIQLTITPSDLTKSSYSEVRTANLTWKVVGSTTGKCDLSWEKREKWMLLNGSGDPPQTSCSGDFTFTYTSVSNGTYQGIIKACSCIPYENVPNACQESLSTDCDTKTLTIIIDSSVDTDGDGIKDTVDTDDDNDGMSDTFELANGFNPLDANDANKDADNDGYSNLIEFQAGTDPNDAQSVPTGIWYVDGSVSTSGNGTDWAQAFKTLQEAVDAIPDKGEIWIKQGTYVLSSSIDIKKPVAIYGGFAGFETDKSQRDWDANVTTIKEDIDFYSADGTIVDGFSMSGIAVYDTNGITITHCQFDRRITAENTENLAITNCQLKKWGFYGYDSDVTVSHSIFLEGAGVNTEYSNMTVAHSTFSHSNIDNKYNSSMILSHSSFDETEIFNYESEFTITDAHISNSGIDNDRFSVLTIENGKFSNSEISNSYSMAEFTNCSFDGKGIYSFRSTVSLTNCTVSNMTGTAIANGETFLYITHGTFYNNGTAISNAASERGASSVDITNSIFWKNGTAIINDPGEFEWGSVKIAYSNIFDGGYEGEGIEEGEGNINADPLFVDAASGNFRLKANSPAIDTGTSDEEAPTTDIEGNPRPFGNGYDMGAYEYHNQAPVANFTVTPSSGEAPLTVILDASESSDPEGSIVDYQWFIDGQTYSGETLTTTFAEPSIHSIVLKVTDNSGASDLSDVKKVTVVPPNQPPIASFMVEPTSGEAPLTVKLDAGPSVDTDSSMASYSWSVNNQTLSGETTQITFDEPGSYPIILTVTDDKGDESAPVERIVTVEPPNQPPVPEFTITPQSGTVPLSVTVDASASTDDGTIVSYTWSISTGKTDSNQQAQFDFESGGIHKIQLTVTDDKGQSATLEKTVEALKKTIRLAVVDYPQDIKPGEDFDITLQFVPEQEKPIDGIAVYLEFDPEILQVNSITNSGELDFELKNEIGDNYIDFAAVIFANEVPTEEFDLLTINFTALEVTGDLPTLLQFVPENTNFTSQGEYISQDYEDIPITIGEEITLPACNLKWEGRPDTPPEDANWETELDIYCSSTDGKKCGVTANVDSTGNCTITGTIPPDTEFICVKGSNTLANRITEPFSEPVDFGTFLVGDVNDDGKIEMDDFSLLGTCNQKSKSCEADMECHQAAIENCSSDIGKGYPDLDGNGKLERNDMVLANENLDRPTTEDYDDGNGLLCQNETGDANNPRYRRGQRDGSKSGTLVLNTTPIPTSLAIGDSFDVAIRVDASMADSVDGVAAHLNFEPSLLQVNQITPGHQLDFVLKNAFDNTQGQIDYAAVLFGNDIPTDTFTVVVINFTLLGQGGERTLAFNTISPRNTVATFAGKYVNAPVQNDWIVFDEQPIEYVISDYLFDNLANPVAGVQVHIGDQMATTDANGHWKVKVPEGEYTMTVSKEGKTVFTVPCKIGAENSCSLNFVNLDVAMAAPASCQIYAVNDKGVNNSQIFTVNLDDFSITELGQYPKHDLEALDIDPRTDIIYLASGDNASPSKKGHLYVLDGETGELFPVGSTGFKEIEDLAFSSDGTLWAWAKGDGMISIDLVTGVGTLQIDYDAKVEGLTLSQSQSNTFYGSVGKQLWVYDQAANQLQVACDNLPGETEALEMLPDGLLLMGIHKDKSSSLHAFDVNNCKIVPDINIPTHPFDDVEGIALPVEACAK